MSHGSVALAVEGTFASPHYLSAMPGTLGLGAAGSRAHSRGDLPAAVKLLDARGPVDDKKIRALETGYAARVHSGFVQARHARVSDTTTRPNGARGGFSRRQAVMRPAESRSRIVEAFG